MCTVAGKEILCICQAVPWAHTIATLWEFPPSPIQQPWIYCEDLMPEWSLHKGILHCILHMLVNLWYAVCWNDAHLILTIAQRPTHALLPVHYPPPSSHPHIWQPIVRCHIFSFFKSPVLRKVQEGNEQHQRGVALLHLCYDAYWVYFYHLRLTHDCTLKVWATSTCCGELFFNITHQMASAACEKKA